MTIILSHKILITGALAIAFIAPTFANAESSSSTTTEVKQSKERHVDKIASSTVNRTCMAAAVSTREAALKSTWLTFTSSVTTALDKRASALVAAWNNSDDSKARPARKEAWDDWRDSKKAAQTKLRTERKSAWEAFKKTAKETCKVNTAKAEGLEKSGSDSIAL